MTLLLRPIRKITPSLLRNTAKFSSAAHNSSFDDSTSGDQSLTKLFNPTEEHAALRQMVRSFAEREVSPTLNIVCFVALQTLLKCATIIFLQITNIITTGRTTSHRIQPNRNIQPPPLSTIIHSGDTRPDCPRRIRWSWIYQRHSRGDCS